MLHHAKVKVCINYLVKLEKIQTFLSDLSRAAYLNFRRMVRGFSLSFSFSLFPFFLLKNILSTHSAFSEIKLWPKIGGLGFEQVFIIESKML